MDKLIKSIDLLLTQITASTNIKESLEWYLVNNLNEYKTLLSNNPSEREFENATRALTRFCTESMDWDNPLYEACSEITTQGIKLAKQLKGKK